MSFMLGCISLFLYVMVMIVFAITIISVALFTALLPKKWRHIIQLNFLHRTPEWYARVNRWISLISTRHRWDVLGTGTLKKNGWYVMISNHRSWLDIIVLGNVFDKKIPALKFFMKKELLWQLPLAGWACYFLGYPFMSRHSHAEIRKNPALKGKDIETTQQACKHLRQYPTTLINFAEGTRFTEMKRARQQSPFHYLLKPHAGGAAIVVNELQDILSGIVNVTICYPQKTPSVWDFACGKFEKIVVRYDVLPMTRELLGDYYADRNFRATLQQWFNAMWQSKDEMIERLKAGV